MKLYSLYTTYMIPPGTVNCMPHTHPTRRWSKLHRTATFCPHFPQKLYTIYNHIHVYTYLLYWFIYIHLHSVNWKNNSKIKTEMLAKILVFVSHLSTLLTSSFNHIRFLLIATDNLHMPFILQYIYIYIYIYMRMY